MPDKVMAPLRTSLINAGPIKLVAAVVVGALVLGGLAVLRLILSSGEPAAPAELVMGLPAADAPRELQQNVLNPWAWEEPTTTTEGVDASAPADPGKEQPPFHIAIVG